MAAITVINPDFNGEDVVPATASAGGDTVAVDGHSDYLFHFRNGSGSATTVTFDDPTSQAPAGGTTFNPDVAVSVGATSERIHRIQSGRFRNSSNGNMALTYSSATSLTVSVYRA